MFGIRPGPAANVEVVLSKCGDVNRWQCKEHDPRNVNAVDLIVMTGATGLLVIADQHGISIAAEAVAHRAVPRHGFVWAKLISRREIVLVGSVVEV